MNYIVIDLEWNQSPKGKEYENTKIPFEIIEIGAVKLDSSMNTLDEFCSMIKPNIYKEMHFKIKEITRFNIKDFAYEKDFLSVIKEFILWCGEDFTFCTWGTLDLMVLQKNMSFYHLERVFGFPLIYYDVQKLFSIYFEDRKIRRSLEYAVNYLNIGQTIPFHRALSDAYYTAEVLKELDFEMLIRDYSIDTFYKPRNKEEEIIAIFDTYSKYISRIFDSKEKALQDKEVTSTRCYLCGKNAKKKIRWFSDNARMYYSLSYCEEHGFLKGKLRMKKEDDKFHVVKTLKLSGEEGANIIKSKQKEIRLRRKQRRKSHS